MGEFTEQLIKPKEPPPEGGFTRSLLGFKPIPEPGTGTRTTGQRVARRADDLARAVASGVTFGFADELAAQADVATGRVGSIEEGLERERQRDREIPASTRITGELIGGAATGLGTVKALPKAVSTIPRIATTSAVEGALAGAGFAEGGVKERVGGAATGAVFGATLGFVIPGASKAVSTAIARRSTALPKDQRFAVNRIIKELERGGITAKQAAKRAEKLGVEGILADVDELRPLSRAVAGSPGPGKRIAETVIEGRQAGARQRMQAAISDVVSDTDFGQFRQNLIADRKKIAAELYDEARAFGVLDRSPAIEKVLTSAPIKSAIKSVKSFDPELQNLDDLDMEVLDQVYKRLSERSFGPGNARGLLTRVMLQLKEAVAEQVPVYRTAVDTFSDKKTIEEALEQGRKFLSGDDFVTSEILKDMTEGAREAYVVGVSRAMSDQVLSGTPRANVAMRVFSAKNAPKIKAALGGTKRDFDAFKRSMIREMEFAETTTQVLRGSRTAVLNEEQKDLVRLAGRWRRALNSMKQGDVAAAGIELFSRTGQKPPITDGQSKALAQLLFRSQGPGEGRLLAPSRIEQLIRQATRPAEVATALRPAAVAAPAGLISEEAGGQRTLGNVPR